MKPVFLLPLLLFFGCQPAPESLHWYKGNLHTHSLWSDGDEFPEMIMAWYADNGYQFVGLSDHNILQEGEKWVRVPNNPIRREAFGAYLETFGPDWVIYTEEADTLRVQLQTLDRYRPLFEKKDSFLILKSQEITSGFEGKPIHINATNIDSLIPAAKGSTMLETMQKNIDAVMAQRKATGQPMFPHINHPNFGWAMDSEVMKELENERFFEVYNGHPLVNNYGDSIRMGTEAMWDDINLHYLREGKPLMFGLATDDSHHYHNFGPKYSNAGRGWVMVRAATLSPEALIEAMEAGEFYATTGVELSDYEVTAEGIRLEIVPEEGIEYRIEFLGAGPDDKATTIRQESLGASATYAFGKNDRMVRVRITSSKDKSNPFSPGDKEMAWTQPIARSL